MDAFLSLSANLIGLSYFIGCGELFHIFLPNSVASVIIHLSVFLLHGLVSFKHLCCIVLNFKHNDFVA